MDIQNVYKSGRKKFRLTLNKMLFTSSYHYYYQRERRNCFTLFFFGITIWPQTALYLTMYDDTRREVKPGKIFWYMGFSLDFLYFIWNVSKRVLEKSQNRIELALIKKNIRKIVVHLNQRPKERLILRLNCTCWLPIPTATIHLSRHWDFHLPIGKPWSSLICILYFGL